MTLLLHNCCTPRAASLILLSSKCNNYLNVLTSTTIRCSSSSSMRIKPKVMLSQEPTLYSAINVRKLEVVRREAAAGTGGFSSPPLALTEDNVRLVLADARLELGQIFDTSVGITGQVELAELDGPFVTISLRGRFWHKRSDVLARIGNYLKQRIPEILEVEIEDEKQLDDSPENF